MTTTIGVDLDWQQVADALRQARTAASLDGYYWTALSRAADLCDMRARQVRGIDSDGATPVHKVPLVVCVESPLRGDIARNTLYADACMLDCLQRGEAPFLGHLLYPRVLNDADLADREQGIKAHCAWLRRSQLLAVYMDLGVSDGMQQAVALAHELKLPVIERSLGYGWMEWIANVRPTKGFLEG